MTDSIINGKALAEEVDAQIKRDMRSDFLEKQANRLYPVPAREIFEPAEGDPEEGTPAEPTVEFKHDFGLVQIGLALIHDKYPYKFSHLKPIHIEYLWKRKGGMSKGQPRYGGVMAAPPVLSGILDGEAPDFIVWLAADHARNNWTGRMIEAAVFHQLSHLSIGDGGNLVITGHDFEGFHDELVEYKDLSPLQAETLGRWRQLSLWGGDR